MFSTLLFPTFHESQKKPGGIDIPCRQKIQGGQTMTGLIRLSASNPMAQMTAVKSACCTTTCVMTHAISSHVMTCTNAGIGDKAKFLFKFMTNSFLYVT
jgi:hypothetical protein